MMMPHLLTRTIVVDVLEKHTADNIVGLLLFIPSISPTILQTNNKVTII